MAEIEPCNWKKEDASTEDGTDLGHEDLQSYRGNADKISMTMMNWEVQHKMLRNVKLDGSGKQKRRKQVRFEPK
jgi:hypothetical protein